jgi:hypothetical protein
MVKYRQEIVCNVIFLAIITDYRFSLYLVEIYSYMWSISEWKH